MKKELDDALCRDFPLLYRDRYTDMSGSCMCWGFPGDGWEPIIRRLSEKLEAGIVEYMAKHPDREAPRAAQVKEKFGTLRFYMTGETEEMGDAIHLAEKESAKVCERCGQPGKVRNSGGWLLAICEPCNAKRMADRPNE